jgi:adenylosuccinate synthase
VQPIHTFGVAKAYDTKVGTHTFLTQMDDAHPLGAKLKKLEFGTSTGRQRMVGWYDAVEKGDALRYGGFQDLMINKLDASRGRATGGATCGICTAYETPTAGASARAEQRGRPQGAEARLQSYPGMGRGHLRRPPLRRPARERRRYVAGW